MADTASKPADPGDEPDAVSDESVLKALVADAIERGVHLDKRDLLERWQDEHLTDDERDALLTDDERAAQEAQRKEDEKRRRSEAKSPARAGAGKANP